MPYAKLKPGAVFACKYLSGLFEQLRTGINIIVAAVSGKSNERLPKLYKRNSLVVLSNRSMAALL